MFSDENLVIEPDTQVIVFIIGIHHDPQIYPNPKEFIPERFSPEEKAKRHPFAFIPFSAGPRKCVGYKWAILEMLCLTSKLLRHYNISTTDKFEDLVILPYITLTLEKPINFIFERRNLSQ